MKKADDASGARFSPFQWGLSRTLESGIAGIDGATILTGAPGHHAEGLMNSGAMHAFTITTNGCPADLDGNGTIDGGDLTMLLGAWGELGGATDLTTLLGMWGDCS